VSIIVIIIIMPNSHLKVKGQGHQGEKTTFLALSAVCVQFMFGKTSLASIFHGFC